MTNKIKESNISDGAVTSNKIAPGTIAADRLAGSITNSQLAGSIANAKLANSTITVNGTSIALGASGDISAGTDWQAVKTANYTAVAGQGIFANTTGGSFTITLPASPSAGDEVHIKDYARTFGTNSLTIARNGSNVDGTTSDITLSTNGQSIGLVYMDATKGWSFINQDETSLAGATYINATGGTVVTSGDYKIHQFTSSSNFVVSTVGNPAGGGAVVDYLVVAGGGGAARDNAGGGGAGGVRFYASPDITSYPASPRNAPAGITVSAQTYPISVGAGGGPGNLPGSGDCAPGQRGSNSVFSTITSTGGGGSNGDGQPATPKSPGGSGGGEGQGAGAKGSGNTPPVSPSQGSDGGENTANPGGGGGGGGFMAAGSNNSGNTGGAGGVGGGFPSTFVGSPNTGIPSGGEFYFGGGGGAGNGQPGGSPGGAGGTGGGGAGSASAPGNVVPGTAGTANTGGGGGGGGQAGEGSTGGSGVVILRYKYQN